MTTAIILDAAHGKDVSGKRSPDGLHREYYWSRERCFNIRKQLWIRNPGFEALSPLCQVENEIGLTERVKLYNEIAKDYSFTYVLSLHNDAEPKKTCDSEGWGKARGISVWTSRGEDESDPIATSLYNYLKVMFPNDKFRPAYWLSEKEKIKDPDWEANFTILAGNKHIKPNYLANLLEWRFQTNKEDVSLLRNKVHNEHLEDMICNWLVGQFGR